MEEKITIKTNNSLPITIEIPFEEYKELLIIKGRYEELKSQKEKTQTIDWNPVHIKDFPNLTQPSITYGDRTNEPLPESPYKITCCDCHDK